MRKSKIGVMDFETDPFEHGAEILPFCAGFYDGEDYMCYWGPNCVEYLVEDLAEFKGTVYAHNGGKFDFHFMLDFVEPGQVKIINGRIAQMKIGKCTLRDSFLILPVPLSAYAKDDIDYMKFKRDVRENHKREILDYLESDCNYLFEMVSQFREEFGNGLTMPGIAFKRMEKTVGEIYRGNINHDERFRPFYFGGRVSCFEKGEIPGPLEFVDINSSYPNAMQYEHPIGPIYNVVDFIPVGRPNCAFYHVLGYSDGVFPVRTKTGIDFPVGYGEFMVPGYEYNAGIDTGAFKLDQVISVRIPHETISFEKFVELYYGLRLKADERGDELFKLFYKLVLNSPYGKLATNPENFRDYRLVRDDEEIDGDEWEPEFQWWGDYELFSRPVDPESPAATYYDVATAASITGFSRAKLWRGICDVKRPIYCDTDSILCKSPGDLPMSKKLGDWDREANVTRAWVVGKKMYALETDKKDKDGEVIYKTASKGVRASVDQIKRAAGGETVMVESIAPTFSVKQGNYYQRRKIRKT